MNRLISWIIHLRFPWYCDCHESDCDECVTRWFNHKGYRCDSPVCFGNNLEGRIDEILWKVEKALNNGNT